MNRSSAFIPDGLLPSSKSNPREYQKAYYKLRMQYDPTFKEYERKRRTANNHKRARMVMEAGSRGGKE